MASIIELTRPETCFDPEAVIIIEDAWNRLTRSGSECTRPAYARAMREVLAKRIFDLAQRGVIDQKELADFQRTDCCISIKRRDDFVTMRFQNCSQIFADQKLILDSQNDHEGQQVGRYFRSRSEWFSAPFDRKSEMPVAASASSLATKGPRVLRGAFSGWGPQGMEAMIKDTASY